MRHSGPTRGLDSGVTGDPTPPGSDYSWLPVTERIQEDGQQWFFNFSGFNSAMDSSSEILERLTFWKHLLGEK